MSQPTPSPRIPRLLETKRIYLRPFESTDVDTYFPGLFDAELRRLTGTQNSFTRTQVERYIENAAQDDSRLMLLIALQEDDEVIGEIALMDMHTKIGVRTSGSPLIILSTKEKVMAARHCCLCWTTASASAICTESSLKCMPLISVRFVHMRSSDFSAKVYGEMPCTTIISTTMPFR